MAMLKGARRSIRIQALVFKGDEAGLRIAEVLKAKKAEGLDVRVIVDAFSNPWLQTQWMFFDLKQHGIEVEGYEALALQWLNEVPVPHLTPHYDAGRMDKRFHEKLWLIDVETPEGLAVTGGLNIGNEYFRVDPTDPAGYWRDQDVAVRGAVLQDLTEAFDVTFDYLVGIKESRGILNTNLYWNATRSVLDHTGKFPVSYETDPRLDGRVEELEQGGSPPALRRKLHHAGLSQADRSRRAGIADRQRLFRADAGHPGRARGCGAALRGRDAGHQQPGNQRPARNQHGRPRILQDTSGRQPDP
jgi:phosphatidylserine/phosphatidylglycerophosphate/cardiolipin synthase-like enzyme